MDGGEVEVLLDALCLTLPIHSALHASPPSLLPTDIALLPRSPFSFRLFFRRHPALDLRCFAPDRVWIQPCTPPAPGDPPGDGEEGGAEFLVCPQFAQIVREHLTSLSHLPEPEGAARYPFSPSPGVAEDVLHGGVMVPLRSLPQVMSATWRYLGAVWLFKQVPRVFQRGVAGGLAKEFERVVGILYHDVAQPSLRFRVGYSPTNSILPPTPPQLYP